MGQPKFKVCSITHAEKGIRLLNENGFRAHFIRTPDPDSEEGCCYTIYLTKGYAPDALKILRDGHVRLTGDAEGGQES